MPPRLAIRSLFFLAPLALLAQGPLTPPGAPAPQGKTLAQVEPRQDIALLAGDPAATRVISAPGSYYLTADLIGESGKVGIRVDASHVTIDLNGFRLQAGASPTIGLQLNNGPTAVAIVNGSLLGWTDGIASTNGVPVGVRLSDLVINGRNGVEMGGSRSVTVTRVSVRFGVSGGQGIMLGETSTVVTQCTVSDSPGETVIGIAAGVVSQCSVDNLVNDKGGVTGIRGGMVSDCSVTNVRSSSGGNVVGIFGSSVTQSRVNTLAALGSGATATGIFGGIISDCSSAFVSAASGEAAGISAGEVGRCRVSDISTSGSGTVVGIRGENVTDNSVAAVGLNGSVPSAANGIISDAVSNCQVRNVRGGTSAEGITASDVVTDSTVRGVDASGTVVGVRGAVVRHCRATSVGTGAPAPDAATGITGDSVSDCSVQDVRGVNVTDGIFATGRVADCVVRTVNNSSGQFSTGIRGYVLATGCSVSTVFNLGTGSSAGFYSGIAGETRNCNARNTYAIGILHGDGGAVRGCTVTAISSGSGSGIGISCSSNARGPGASTIEDNFVSDCSVGIICTNYALVARNRVTSITGQKFSALGSQIGPIVSTTGTIPTTNAWANFTD